MTVEQMRELKRGDLVKVQFDQDEALEDGIIVKVGNTRCLVIGEDPELGGFYTSLRASRIIEKVGQGADDDWELRNIVAAFVRQVQQYI